MLGKLMKYDFKWINKIMMYYYIFTIVISVVTRILSNFRDTFIQNLIYGIFRGILIGCFINIVINCLIRIWVRFRDNIYKDESYLTHTLPVTKNDIFNAKSLVAIISVIVSIFVVIIGILIAFLDDGLIQILKEMFKDNNIVIIIVSVTILTTLEMISMVFSGIVGIIIGNRCNNKRVLRAVLVGIMIYWAIQMAMIGLLYAYGLFNSDINELFKTNLASPETIKSLSVVASIMYLVFDGGLYLFGKKLLNKGVNVD